MSFNLLDHPIALTYPERLQQSAWLQHIPLAMTLMDILRPRTFVELGTYSGVSYCAFCQAVKELHLDTRCHAVDTWRGDPQTGEYGPNILADLHDHHDPRYISFSQLIQRSFDDAIEIFADRSIDLLHVDGYHTYDAVQHDVQSWMPKLSDRGVLVMHDITEMQSGFGVWQVWAELKRQYPTLEVEYGHGLGVAAIGSQAPQALLELMRAPSEELSAFKRLFFALGMRIELNYSLGVSEEEQANAKSRAQQLAGEISRVTAEESRQQLHAEAQLTALSQTIAELSGKLSELAVRNEHLAQTERELTTSLDSLMLEHEIVAAEHKSLASQLHIVSQSNGILERDAEWLRYEYNRTSSRVIRRAINVLSSHPLFVRSAKAVLLPPARLIRNVTARRSKAPSTGATESLAILPATQTTDTVGAAKIKALQRMLDHMAESDAASYPNCERWYTDTHPEVSIVILNLNKAAMTIRCLRELWKHTAGYSYEIIVVDNGSRPEDYSALIRLQGKFRLIRLSRNRFFGEGNNIGVEAARGRFLVFLNNDALVTPHWLEPLRAVFDEHEKVGAVGPKFVYPDGVLQEAGALVNEDGTVHMLGRGNKNANDPKFNTMREVDYCSAAALMVSRDDFMQVRGFDLTWEPAYYEDVDLCMKIRALGHSVYYCPQTTVVHIEHFTSEDTSHSINFSNVVEVNRQKFLARWGTYLTAQGAVFERGAADEMTFVELNAPARVIDMAPTPTRRVGIYTPYDLIPGGGEKVLLTIAEHLSHSSEVFLITDEVYSNLRLETLGRVLDVDLSRVRMGSYDQIAQLAPFDVFLAMGNEIVPPVPAYGHQNYFLCQFPFPRPDAALVARRAYWDQYQHAVVYSEFVRSHFVRIASQSRLTSKRVDVLSPPCFSEADTVPSAEQKKNALIAQGSRVKIISVGRFFPGEHCKRHDALIDAFKILVDRNRTNMTFELHLAGGMPPTNESRAYYEGLVTRSEGYPVHFHLDADRDELEQLYETSTLYWHATGIDTDPLLEPSTMEHFGITVVEAMAYGCVPLVVNKGGPSDIVQHGVSGLHYSTRRDLAKQALDLLASPTRLEALREAAMRRAHDFTTEVFEATIDQMISADAGNGFHDASTPTHLNMRETESVMERPGR